MAEINSTAQAASALTGVSDVLSPVFTLWYLQKNITTDIAPMSPASPTAITSKASPIPLRWSWTTPMAAGWISGIRARVTR